MRTSKQLTVCLMACLVLSFAAAVHAAPYERWSTPVTVVNPNNKPIPVTEVNKYPVQQQVMSTFKGFLWLTTASLYTVPANKRLIIEYFSCRNGNAGSYSTSYSCYISTGIYPNNVDHFLPTTPYGHYAIAIDSSSDQLPNPKAFISAGQKVQIYAEPGTEVLAGAFRQNQGILSVFDYPEEYMFFSFSGYLIDIAP